MTTEQTKNEARLVAEGCECGMWCREGQAFLTKHHSRCNKYAPEADAREIIVGLLRGIEAWANDEYGVHPDCWEAYKRAKVSVWEGSTIFEKQE